MSDKLKKNKQKMKLSKMEGKGNTGMPSIHTMNYRRSPVIITFVVLQFGTSNSPFPLFVVFQFLGRLLFSLTLLQIFSLLFNTAEQR